MNLTLKIYEKNGFKLIEEMEVETKIKELWWQKKNLLFNSTGYGKKIPTRNMVKYKNKWYRVYCHIFSNSGSCYITAKDIHNNTTTNVIDD